MPGGALLLVVRGASDLPLTGNPEMSLFKTVYRRHTPFSYENVRLYFTGQPGFGQRVFVNLNRRGDLVGRMYLELSLPNLNLYPDQNPDYVVSWVNGIGNFIIREVEVQIGGTTFDKQYGQWLQIWHELTLPDEKKPAYRYMTGYHLDFTPAKQPGPLRLRVPMNFWFNNNLGLVLPLIQLSAQEVNIYFSFQDFESCWVSNTGRAPGLGGLESSQMEGTQFGNCWLSTDYYFLGQEERMRFVNEPSVELLIPQLQVGVFPVANINEDLYLSFTRPVKELVWVFQSALEEAQDPVRSKEPFDFSNGANPPGDPLNEARFWVNGEEIFRDFRDNIYFRVQQPYNYHTSVPLHQFIYMYSFAQYPEAWQPSGTLDFSATDSVMLQIHVPQNVAGPGAVCNIYGVNYNWMLIKEGMAFLAWS